MGQLDFAYTAIGLIVLLGGTWFKARPAIKRRAAADNAILGKAPVTDRAGRVMEPAQPGLIHLQRENSEQITKLQEAVTLLAADRRETQDLRSELGAAVIRIEGLESTVGAMLADRWESGAQAALAATEAKTKDVINVEEVD